MKKEKIESKGYRIIFSSDVSEEKDGLGLEVWEGDKHLIEIFRDDKRKVRTIHVTNGTSLELVEQVIDFYRTESNTYEFIENEI